jgi:hypothetical protein
MKFLLLSFVMLSTASYAVTDSDTLSLTATVAETVSITVVADSNATGLDLHTTKSDLAVAAVTEASNAANGYKVLAKSANNGTIKHSTAASNVAYTMKYDGGSAVTLSTSDAQIKSKTSGVYTGEVSAATISYTGVAATSLLSGSYSDTITFTIESL